MGSGKSTTMRFVAKALEDAGLPALAVHERSDPHPVRATDELQHWFEPWRESTAEQLARRAVSRWRSFAEEVRLNASVPVLDGQLFHGDLTNLFLMEASFDDLAAYCDRLVHVIEPLNPLVVYLRQQNVERAVRLVCAERGEAWVKYQVDWKLKGPYAVRRSLAGLEGLIALYQDYRLMTDALFDRLRLDKMVIENSERDWARYNQQVLERLGLDGVPSAN
ncbi:hypothetical protein DW355_07580 [Hylemonella gracilis]|uniref:Deoxynucleoside kinase domain-containing protein n=2 Tax=Hylemonella gracilis TaxID=80880 RepID=A0A4P6UMF9_9BURK|nr:hypothetical protein DW355_07580 [Hylemonella gracilis]